MELLLYSALGLTGVSAAGLAVVYYVYPILLLKAYSRYLLYSSSLKEKRVVVGNRTFCYAEQGRPQGTDEPTLLFLHGLGGDKEVWIPMLKMLPRELNVIILDMPGHGGSTATEYDDLSFSGFASTIHEFVSHLSLGQTKLHLIGQSLGGAVAYAYTRLYPERVAMLSLACPVMKTPKDDTEFAKIQKQGRNPLAFSSLEDMEWLLKNAAHEPIEVPRQIMKAMLNAKRSSKSFYERVMAEVKSSNQDTFLERHMQDVYVPTQVLWGEQDKLIDKSGWDVLVKGLPLSTASHLIRNCGHSIQLEQPAAFAGGLMELRSVVLGKGDNFDSK